MFSIEQVVWTVLYLLGAAAIFGLLFYAISYCEGEFPGGKVFFRFARIFLVIAACFILIFIILGMMGHPILTSGGTSGGGGRLGSPSTARGAANSGLDMLWAFPW